MCMRRGTADADGKHPDRGRRGAGAESYGVGGTNALEREMATADRALAYLRRGVGARHDRHDVGGAQLARALECNGGDVSRYDLSGAKHTCQLNRVPSHAADADDDHFFTGAEAGAARKGMVGSRNGVRGHCRRGQGDGFRDTQE